MAGYIGSKASVVSSGAERKKTFAITTSTTSLTGLVYTPNKVHVFHNGIRLVDGTDYTATDGTTITLTNAAANGDEVVVVSYAAFQTSDTVSASAGGTFAGDVTFDGAFTSQGIDDNATSTAMTLDSSGNLLVNQTSFNTGNVGGGINSSGFNFGTVDGGVSARFTRLTSDGDIVQFRKDGSTVGSIGTLFGDLYVATGNTGIRCVDANRSISAYDSNANGLVDAAVDLGFDTTRFKDLYLSGGAYLGGTTSSNKLDDYEEGTWTPSFVTITGPTYSGQTGYYTKIGDAVTFHMRLGWSAGTSIGNQVDGLPFAVKGSAGMYPMCSVWNNQGTSYASGRTTLIAYPTINASYITLDVIGSGISSTGATFNSSGEFYVTGHYYTNS